MLVLMVILLLLAGCGGASSMPKPGFWEGQGQNLTVAFEVTADGKIHNFTTTYVLDGSTCTIQWDEDVLISAADRTFLFGKQDPDGKPAKNSFSGRFSSATTVEGVRGLILQCDDMVVVSTQDTWNARWSQSPNLSQQHPATPVPTPTLAPETATFRNPLNNSGPDPWMTYYEGHYYLATTTWGGAIAGLTMRKATTIAGLKEAQPVSVWIDTTPMRCCNFWAPEFVLLDGPNGPRWYGYYTAGTVNCCDNQHMHVIESVSTDPLGPYTYKGQLSDSIGGWAIDASVLQLDGALYLLFSAWKGNNQNLYIAPLSDPWTLSGDRVLLSTPAYTWEKQTGNVNEGAVALQRDGKTFIIYSASACWGPDYKLGMLTYTGTDPLDPNAWTKSTEPVFQRSDATGVFAPGHNTFFKSPDGTEDWIIYHANDAVTGGCDMNRTPRIQKFTWNGDGTPNFGVPVSTSTDLPVPAGEPPQQP